LQQKILTRFYFAENSDLLLQLQALPLLSQKPPFSGKGGFCNRKQKHKVTIFATIQLWFYFIFVDSQSAKHFCHGLLFDFARRNML